MNKCIEVKDGAPAANKKGIRIKIHYVELDENNVLQALYIEYSGLHERGGGIIEVRADRNPFCLPEE